MKHIEYQLKPATIDDCLAISNSFDSLNAITEWGGEGFRFPVQTQQFLLQLHRPDTASYLLSHQGNAVGFGQICQRFGRHHLARLLILPKARGTGQSYLLIQSLIAKALQQNPRLNISLYVFRQNERALHCYRQLGFVETKQPGPHHPGLYFMQLEVEKAQQLLLRWQQHAAVRLTTDAVNFQQGEPDVHLG